MICLIISEIKYSWNNNYHGKCHLTINVQYKLLIEYKQEIAKTNYILQLITLQCYIFYN